MKTTEKEEDSIRVLKTLDQCIPHVNSLRYNLLSLILMYGKCTAVLKN